MHRMIAVTGLKRTFGSFGRHRGRHPGRTPGGIHDRGCLGRSDRDATRKSSPWVPYKEKEILMLCTAKTPVTATLSDFWIFFGHWADTGGGTPAKPPAAYMIAGT